MANTPIPRTATEMAVRPCNEMEEYTLSPAELEEIRRKYPAPEKKGRQKPPIEIKTGGAKTVTNGKDGPDSGLTKRIFLEQLLAGESIGAIEKNFRMKLNTLPYWVKKWGLQGVSPGEAKRLLAEMDGDPTPPAEPPAAATAEGGDQKAQTSDQRIQELIIERDRLATENRSLHARLVDANDRASEAGQRERAANAKAGEYIQAIRELEERVAELESNISAMDEPMTEPQPASAGAEAERIDELISTLSRARWILERVAT